MGPGGGSGGSSVSLSASGGTVTFGANETAVFLNVEALSDELIEGTEGFRVTVLDGGMSYQAGWGGSGGSGGSGEWDASFVEVQITDMSFASGGSGGESGGSGGESGGSGGESGGSGGESGGSGGESPPAQVWVSPESQTVIEGSSGGMWVYRSGGDSSQPLTVSLAIEADGTGDPLAAWGDDYTLMGPSGGSGGSSVSLSASGGTVTFGANETAVFLNVEALSDELIEGTEGFRVTVLDGGMSYQAGWGGSGGSGGSGGPVAGDVRITDNTPVVNSTATTLAVSEDPSVWGQPVTFTATVTL